MIKEKELIVQLQKLLDTVQYRYNLQFTCGLVLHPYDKFWLKSWVKVECAYKRDGSMVDLAFYGEYSIHQLPGAVGEFNSWIRHVLRDFEMHEVDEWLLINGERVFDPHTKEKTNLVERQISGVL